MKDPGLTTQAALRIVRNMLTPQPPVYVVLCRDDLDTNAIDADYCLASRNLFATRKQAVAYACGINLICDPLVVTVDYVFSGLRLYEYQPA